MAMPRAFDFKPSSLNGARETYIRARGAAQALPPGPDRDAWLREAEQALDKGRQ
jgi:hypothetical protein